MKYKLTQVCVQSRQLGCQHDIVRICCRAEAPGCGAAAAGRPALSIDIFCAYGAQQQTRSTPLLRSTDGTD